MIKDNYINKSHKKVWNEILIKDNLLPLYNKGNKVYLKIERAYEGRPTEEVTKIYPLNFKYVNIDGKMVNTAYVYNEFKEGKLSLVVKGTPAISKNSPLPTKYLP